MESMGIYKNKSMESMESMESMGRHGISSILLLIISRKHGKYEKYGKKAWKAWKSMGFMQMNLHPFGSLAFLASASTLVTWLAHSLGRPATPMQPSPASPVALPS